MLGIELLEIVIERVAMHEVRGVGSGQKIEVLAKTLLGARGVPPAFGIELTPRFHAADKQTQSRPQAQRGGINDLSGASRLRKVREPMAEVRKEVADGLRQARPERRQRLYGNALARAAARRAVTWRRMI